jgi:predicted RNase H-like HicB family nuclease
LKKLKRIILLIHRIFQAVRPQGVAREEVEQNMQQAIGAHLQGLLEDNESIPESCSFAEYIAFP